MNEQEIELINNQTRNERFKNFFRNNKKKIFLLIFIFIIIIISYFFLKEVQESKKIGISEDYNSIIINYNENNKLDTANKLKTIILKKDETYSPLALYFIIDNNLIDSTEDINKFFDIVINETGLEKDIKNLNIYKKALFNSNLKDEKKLLSIISPIIETTNPWQSHSFFLLGEFYYSEGNKEKSKDYFEKILTLNNVIDSIKLETRKRLQRDFSE